MLLAQTHRHAHTHCDSAYMRLTKATRTHRNGTHTPPICFPNAICVRVWPVDSTFRLGPQLRLVVRTRNWPFEPNHPNTNEPQTCAGTVKHGESANRTVHVQHASVRFQTAAVLANETQLADKANLDGALFSINGKVIKDHVTMTDCNDYIKHETSFKSARFRFINACQTMQSVDEQCPNCIRTLALAYAKDTSPHTRQRLSDPTIVHATIIDLRNLTTERQPRKMHN